MMYWFYAVKNQTYADFEPLLIVSLVYYIMNKALSLIGKAIERKPEMAIRDTYIRIYGDSKGSSDVNFT